MPSFKKINDSQLELRTYIAGPRKILSSAERMRRYRQNLATDKRSSQRIHRTQRKKELKIAEKNINNTQKKIYPVIYIEGTEVFLNITEFIMLNPGQPISNLFSSEVENFYREEIENFSRRPSNAIHILENTVFDISQRYGQEVEQLRELESSSIECSIHSCGLMNKICQFCGALHFINEISADGKFKHCCHKGIVRLNTEESQNYPNFLKSLLSDTQNPMYKHFQQNIRTYNSIMSFASMGASIDHPKGQGPYVFKVHGAIYHKVSHLHPPQNENRKNAQLYVIESNIAVQQRLQNNQCSELNENIIHQLDSFFRQHNPYAKAYRMLGEVEKEEIDKAIAKDQEIPKVNMIFRRDRNLDRRRYNLPTVDEVAMIFLADDGEPPFERDFKVYPRNIEERSINLNILSPNLEPMTYVLFRPFGEPGWEPNMKMDEANRGLRKRLNISMLQWKVAHIFLREHVFNPILFGGKLFQQWAVDSYIAVEANNLNYIRFQQKKLRVELYKGLMDHLNDTGNANGANLGKPVILPSSFQGSPRNMREKFCDAMSIVTKYGKPDLFITMTCNPNWEEIQQNLFEGQQPNDRPDLISRVFNLKLKSMLDDIIKKKLFGNVKAWVYTIEFQKRGLPHAHILIILTEQDKLDTPEKIDSKICAEIPDVLRQPRLFEIIKKSMLHGPCGFQNPKAPCMDKGECTKKFPKQYQERTIISPDGYPLYRRREGNQVQVRGKILDNRYVIPYNKILCLRYNCHINVESCQSVKAIKYIFKYIYKGYDCASVELSSETSNDEINIFLNTRYVCAPEAIWRLLENPMHDRSHAIYRLSVHLPNEQLVYFETENVSQAINRENIRKTHLTSWFDLNKEDPEARTIFYNDIPYYYVFNKQKCVWTKRIRGANKIIPRIYTVSPKDEERFHLRLLLLHVPGAQSFDDLKTVEGHIQASFKLAAIKLNLVDDDSEWGRCLEEACLLKMPNKLRELFAVICIFNSPKEPFSLFNRFCEDLIYDFRRFFTNEISIRRALCEINGILQLYGKKCEDFGLPVADNSVMETTYDQAEESAEASIKIRSLNESQRKAFDDVIKSINNNNEPSRFFFIDGPGGSGKTYLYNALMSFLRGKSQSVMAFATTGIAADLLKGGRTVHSGFKIPLSLNETSVSSMRPTSIEANRLKDASLIIIDEASMLSTYTLKIIDILLKEIMCNQRPFGGKTIILGGDFRQTANVVPRGNDIDVIELCIKRSHLWTYVKRYSLSTNMRSFGQSQFNNWVLKVGNGELENLIEIPLKYVKEEDLVHSIFGNKIHCKTIEDVDILSNKIILCTKNEICTQINNKILCLIDGPESTYYSNDSVLSDDINDSMNFPTEFLNKQSPSGMPPHILKLKKGALIMLIRNLNPKKGLLNGTRLIVVNTNKYSIEAEILTGFNKGQRTLIPKIKLDSAENVLPFVMRRCQFPIILAFAITINKSQGQSFNEVGILLKEPVFSHGQLYVALTRCKDSSKIVICTENSINGKVVTRNIVLKELIN